MTVECFRCGAPAVERFANGHPCEECVPKTDGKAPCEPDEDDVAAPAPTTGEALEVFEAAVSCRTEARPCEVQELFAADPETLENPLRVEPR